MSPSTPEIALSLELGLESQQTRSWSKEVEFLKLWELGEGIQSAGSAPQLAQLQLIILELSWLSWMPRTE